MFSFSNSYFSSEAKIKKDYLLKIYLSIEHILFLLLNNFFLEFESVLFENYSKDLQECLNEIYIEVSLESKIEFLEK
jgi:hypothetical protein